MTWDPRPECFICKDALSQQAVTSFLPFLSNMLFFFSWLGRKRNTDQYKEESKSHAPSKEPRLVFRVRFSSSLFHSLGPKGLNSSRAMCWRRALDRHISTWNLCFLICEMEQGRRLPLGVVGRGHQEKGHTERSHLRHAINAP